MLLASLITVDAQNRFAFPNIGGVRLREANITPGTNDSGNGALYGIAANYGDQDYYWTNNGPSGNEWTNWITPQVLAAKSIGANCVRLMWSADTFIGDSSHHGASTWRGTNNYVGLTNEIGMIANLCQTNGMYFYPVCSDSRVIYDGNLDTNLMFQYISNFCAEAVLYPNIPAIDIIQEVDGTTGGTNSWIVIDEPLWFAASNAGMAKSGRIVPITCSLNGASSATDMNINSRPAAAKLVASGATYLDIHSYYMYSQADWYQTVTNKYGLPIVFGETGINMSGVWGSGPDNESVHPYSSEIRQHFFAQVQGIAQEPFFQLEGIWAIAPNWLTNEEDFGLFSGVQNGAYQLTQQRAQVGNFMMFPTNITIPNYTWSIICTGVNTTASSYSVGNYYGVQNAMIDVSGVWQRQNNLIQGLGNVSFVGIPNGSAVLYQTTLPNALGLYIQFDIPPQSPTLYNSEFAEWECIARGQGNGNLYLITLTSDNSHTYDNKAEIFSVVGGTATSLGNITYGSALDLTKWWRVTANISTNINPTVITMTVSNMTSGIVMSPSLVVSDSTSSLQAPGGMGLCTYLGQPYYTNIFFQSIWDYTPTIYTSPTGTTNGTTVNLSWATATNGTGTVQYTPQFVTTDFTTNFPSVNTWTNATQTTSTSEIITGVPASTNVIFRIMTTDSTSTTNYSPWQIFATGLAGTVIPYYLPLRKF